MKYKILFLGLSLLMLMGCGMRERELELEKKMMEVNQKEQELLLKEKSLQIKEDELTKKEKKLDSTSHKTLADSLARLYPELPGVWNVKMVCTETSCPGSAIGDTKNEQWEISFQDNSVIVKAMSGNTLVRTYTGDYTGNSIQISTLDNTSTQATNMIVRLQPTKENEMEGQREIIRPDECHIVYALQLKKQ